MKHNNIHLKLFIVVFLLHGFSLFSHAEKSIDSLRNALSGAHPDSVKANLIGALITEYITIGHYPQADSLIPIQLKLSEDNDYKKGVADATLNKGVLDYYQGLYPQGLDYLLKARQEFDDIQDKHGAALSILYVGYINEGQGDYKKALANFSLASDMLAALKDDDYNATAIIHIGTIYTNFTHDYANAKDYLFKSLTLFRKAGDDDGVASAQADIGKVYVMEENYDNALSYLNEAKTLFEKLNDVEGEAELEYTLGTVYLKQKKFQEALECAEKDREIAKQISSFADTKESEYLMSEAYSAMGKDKEALEHYQAYVSAKDSLTNQENTKKTIQEELSFEFERRQAEVKAEQSKKDAIQQEQSHRQQIIIYFITGILLLSLALGIIAYRSYLQKQRDNKELDVRNKKIEAAYSIIEEKNREITDSINYAERIQNAMLPDVEQINKFLPQSFVLFKPKDIVSGDFFFFHPAPSGIYIAAADCTGHGVPGAFMSMIGSEKLHDAVQEASSTGDVLKLVNTGIRTSLRQSEERGATRDGMDIALCHIATLPSQGGFSIGSDDIRLSYSGANRPLWIIRKGSAEIEEVKADKKAIGGFTEEVYNFETHHTKLNTGDTFYIFSDGYADQFGGPQGKKLSTKKFRELLLSIQNLTMKEQHAHLKSFIESWQGDKEQLDDILVIGIRA